MPLLTWLRQWLRRLARKHQAMPHAGCRPQQQREAALVVRINTPTGLENDDGFELIAEADIPLRGGEYTVIVQRPSFDRN